MRSLQYFPHCKVSKQWLPVLFSLEQISRQDQSYSSLRVLWWAPRLTSTQQKLHPCLGDWFWKVLAVATGDAYSAIHNTSPGVAFPIPSHFVDPLCGSSSFLCIHTPEICVRQSNIQLKLLYHGKSRAPLHAVVHPIYMSCDDSYGWEIPRCCRILPRCVLHLVYCRVKLWSHWS